MPFIKQIVNLTYLLVPGDDKKIGYRDSYQLKYIGEKRSEERRVGKECHGGWVDRGGGGAG